MLQRFDNRLCSILSINPLLKMISEVNDVLKRCKNVVNPKIVLLTEIHKLGKSIKPIDSAIRSPTYNLAMWL